MGWDNHRSPIESHRFPLGLRHPVPSQSTYHFLFYRRPPHRIQAVSVQLSAGLPFLIQYVFVLFPS